MAQQRLALWNTEEDLEEDVDLSIAIGNYGQNMQYEECEWRSATTIVSGTYGSMDPL
jgi:translation initiation factor 3 subunit L